MTMQPDAATEISVAENVVTTRMRVIANLAAELAAAHFPRGDLAALRRLDADHPDAPAFWRLLLTHVADAERHSEVQENRWALVLHGLALMTQPGVSAHRREARIGQVLAHVGFSELRLNRLLRARGEGFRALAPRACRFLAAKGEPIDWARFGLLLLAGEGSPAAERYRREIAREYFRALRAHATDSNN